jgi:hypothetical protein
MILVLRLANMLTLLTGDAIRQLDLNDANQRVVLATSYA